MAETLLSVGIGLLLALWVDREHGLFAYLIEMFGLIPWVISMMVAALLFLCPVLTEYLHTGLVPRLPTFVAACFMALFSLQSFICGLILDTQGKMHRQNFELQMTILSGMYHAAQTTDNEKAK